MQSPEDLENTPLNDIFFICSEPFFSSEVLLEKKCGEKQRNKLSFKMPWHEIFIKMHLFVYPVEEL